MKARKAFTLAEVLVATLIFTIILLSTLTVYLISARQIAKQDDFLAFENICREIDAYSDKYGRSWNEKYFGDNEPEQYYAQNYSHTEKENAAFVLTWVYKDTNGDGAEELIVTVEELGTGRKIIDRLNYGGARYEEVSP